MPARVTSFPHTPQLVVRSLQPPRQTQGLATFPRTARKLMKPRTRWTLTHYWPTPLILLMLLILTATDQWLMGLSWLLWIVVLIVNERGSRHAFHQGWWEGQIWQASVMASDAPEEKKRQLLRITLDPWDQLTRTMEGHDG